MPRLEFQQHGGIQQIDEGDVGDILKNVNVGLKPNIFISSMIPMLPGPSWGGSQGLQSQSGNGGQSFVHLML